MIYRILIDEKWHWNDENDVEVQRPVPRRKTPRRSQIVYRDKLQMVILPDKRKKE